MNQSHEKRQPMKSNHDTTLILDSHGKNMNSVSYWQFKLQFRSDILGWPQNALGVHGFGGQLVIWSEFR